LRAWCNPPVLEIAPLRPQAHRFAVGGDDDVVERVAIARPGAFSGSSLLTARIATCETFTLSSQSSLALAPSWLTVRVRYLWSGGESDMGLVVTFMTGGVSSNVSGSVTTPASPTPARQSALPPARGRVLGARARRSVRGVAQALPTNTRSPWRMLRTARSGVTERSRHFMSTS